MGGTKCHFKYIRAGLGTFCCTEVCTEDTEVCKYDVLLHKPSQVNGATISSSK